MTSRYDIVIIGGGISGLTSAFRLKSEGFSVKLLEKSEKFGGVLQTQKKQGFITEMGPNTVLETSPLVGQLIQELGLENDKIYADETSNVRYIARNKIPHPLPSSPGTFFNSKLFSRSAKLRLLKEPFIKAWDNSYEESLAQFVQRRLGQEFLDYAINPFVAGVYAGSPGNLSVKHGLPKLYALEQKYGGLIKGQIKGARERRKSLETSKQNARMFSFTNGLDTLPTTMADKLGPDAVSKAQVIDISLLQNNWLVTYQDPVQKKSTIFCKAVIYSGQIYALKNITINNKIIPEIEKVEDIYYPPVTILHLGFKKEDVGHSLAGFGMLIPEVEKFNTLGVLFSSSLFKGRAPRGQVLLTVFIGGARQPENALKPKAQLIEMALEDYKVLLNVKKDPLFVHFKTWPRAIPQYDIGYGQKKDYFDHLEHDNQGLFLSGCYRQGISVSDTIVNAWDTSKKVQSFCS
ncbi:MAG: protoporphyrinogen oxidase [Candidatus Neomarinimicrobiota bacterium]